MAGLLTRPRSLPPAGPVAPVSWGLQGRLWFGLLIVAVLLMHGLLTRFLAEHLAMPPPHEDALPRLEVLYVREMALEQAKMQAAAAPLAADRAPLGVVARPAPAASAPRDAQAPADPAKARASDAVTAQPAAAPPAVVEELVVVDRAKPVSPTFTLDTELSSDGTSMAAEAPTASPDDTTKAIPALPPAASAVAAPSLPPAPAVALPGPVDAAPSSDPAKSTAASSVPTDVEPFQWPVSTRIAYRLTGYVRGEVGGGAQVEWIRVGSYYQVHLDVTLGLSVAPMMTRRMSSEGDITVEGLSPRRYEQETKIGFADRRRATVRFEPSAVRLADGRLQARPSGVQDTVSQFIQISYLFATQPDRLRSGGSIDVPLALPRSVSRWTYDVLGEEPVYTPFGAVPAIHLKPRREAQPGGDLSAEMWFAPQLRHLPVRILIHQDAETFIDLTLERRPQLSAN